MDNDRLIDDIPIISESDEDNEGEQSRVYTTRRRKCNICKQYPNLLYKEIGENYTRLYLYKCACSYDSNAILRWDPIQVNAFNTWVEQEPYRSYNPE